MNRTILGIILIVFSMNSLSAVSSDERPRINIKGSFNIIGGFLNAFVDMKVNRVISAGSILGYSTYTLRHFVVGIGTNVKLDDKDIMTTNGLYLNPYYTYSSGKLVYCGGFCLENRSNNTVGLILGHQWIAKSKLNFRLGIGVQYNFENFLGMHFLPDFSMTFGYAF